MNGHHSSIAASVEQFMQELLELRSCIVDECVKDLPRVGEVHADNQAGAENLLHYLALRRRDLRTLQDRLSEYGLSSLGRAEAHVLPTIDAVLSILHLCAGRDSQLPIPCDGESEIKKGCELLEQHTESLLGPPRPERNGRIMVTMPATAADDYDLVHNLLSQGMDCARINCAHDDEATWSRIINNIRQAEKTTGRPCRVAMDLAGPKLRTGAIEAGPAVVKIRPTRNDLGCVTAPARVWLTSADSPKPPPIPTQTCLNVPALWLAQLRTAHQIKFTDARGSKRDWTIIDALPEGCFAEARQTAYVTHDTVMRNQDRCRHEKASSDCTKETC